MNTISDIGIYSEVGKLKRVLVHKPGEEIENITPELMQRLLFDDLPYLKVAREEHDEFVNILKSNDTEVVYLIDAMAEVLEDNDVKEVFLNRYLYEARIEGDGTRQAVKEYLENIPNLKDLVSKLISGIYKKEINLEKILSFADIVNDPYPFVIDPMPNLYFTRDPAAVIGSGASVHRMRTVTRRRETIFTEYLFKYHPLFHSKLDHTYYDRKQKGALEGGDILVLSEKVIAVGISERTDMLAIEKLAQNIISTDESFKTILAFNIPDKRAFMHLDTVFTMIDRDTFTIHPEIENVLKVYSLNKKDGKIKYKEELGTLSSILSEKLEQSQIKLIRCGDGDPVTAAREQWNDGSNTLAIAPGEVVVYDRNSVTNRILEEAGIKLHRMPSSELSRGRGGPRCMSMPLLRS